VEERELLKKLEDFSTSSWSLVVENKQGVLFRSKDDRLLPLLDCIQKHGDDMLAATVLDKMVGRAAALLCVYARVSMVLTPIISDGAVEVLEEFGVPFMALERVDQILNAEHTGPCPMEKEARDKTPVQFYRSLAKQTPKNY
jgi:hypothetical protein